MNESSRVSVHLADLRRRRNSQVPRSRYVMQSLLASSKHSESNRSEGRAHVLDWARAKWPGLIPAFAYEGQAFEHDQAGLRISATRNLNGSIWAFRSEHLGNDSNESRTWVTEAIIADLGSYDAFGARNSCSTLSSEGAPVSSPRFLRDFVQHHALIDASAPVSGVAHVINEPEPFVRFLAFLQNPARSLPIVVVTQFQGRTDYVVDATKLARDVQGLAHVYCLTHSMTFRLSDHLGKNLSVFNGAVRTYNPNFSDEDDPRSHHLVFPQRILEWNDEDGVGSAAFMQFLSRQLHLFSVNTPNKIEQFPSYFSLRRTLLDKPNKTAGEEIQALKLELEETRAKEQEWQSLAEDMDSEAQANEEENRSLRAQNMALAHELKEIRKLRGDVSVPIPDSYADISQWVNSHFSDRLFLHQRAVRALKDAVFENVSLVSESLKLLAEAYWPLRVNQDQSERPALSNNWDQGLKRLQLEYNSHAIAQARLGEFKEDYTVNYRIGQTSRQILGPHLKFGSTKDDRFCMRIYFFWDDDRQLIVIGHLPSHLETRAS